MLDYINILKMSIEVTRRWKESHHVDFIVFIYMSSSHRYFGV